MPFSGNSGSRPFLHCFRGYGFSTTVPDLRFPVPELPRTRPEPLATRFHQFPLVPWLGLFYIRAYPWHCPYVEWRSGWGWWNCTLLQGRRLKCYNAVRYITQEAIEAIKQNRTHDLDEIALRLLGTHAAMPMSYSRNSVRGSLNHWSEYTGSRAVSGLRLSVPELSWNRPYPWQPGSTNSHSFLELGHFHVQAYSWQVSRVDISRIIFQFKSLSWTYSRQSSGSCTDIFWTRDLSNQYLSSDGSVPKLPILYWASFKVVSVGLKPHQSRNKSVSSKWIRFIKKIVE
jgi:hypothetical protein